LSANLNKLTTKLHGTALIKKREKESESFFPSLFLFCLIQKALDVMETEIKLLVVEDFGLIKPQI